MARYGIGIAKDLYYYDISLESDHDTILTRSLAGGKSIFGSILQDDMVYLYESVENPISCVVDEHDDTILRVLKDDYVYNLMGIIIGDIPYRVLNISYAIDGNYLLHLNKGISGTPIEFTSKLLIELDLLWGYCLLEQFLQSGKELVLRDIEFSKDRYVDGSLIPADRDAIRKLRDDIIAKRNMVLSGVNHYSGIYGGNLSRC